MKAEINLTHKHTHFVAPKTSPQSKLQKEYAFYQPEKNCINKNSFPSKNFKNAYTQPND